MNERIGVNYWSVDKSTLETFYSIRKDNIEGGVEAILYGLLEMILPSLKTFCKMPKYVDNILVLSTKDSEKSLDETVRQYELPETKHTEHILTGLLDTSNTLLNRHYTSKFGQCIDVEYAEILKERLEKVVDENGVHIDGESSAYIDPSFYDFAKLSEVYRAALCALDEARPVYKKDVNSKMLVDPFSANRSVLHTGGLFSMVSAVRNSDLISTKNSVVLTATHAMLYVFKPLLRNYHNA